MSGTKLFSPVSIGGLTLRNRIVIAPMCQYSAEDGLHDRLAPYPPRSPWPLSGAGTADHRGDGASRPKGRISYGDVGPLVG